MPVLRKYTSHTCTLEIAGKSSPLSPWAGQPVIKNIQFILQFQEPGQSAEKSLEIRGDRAQLEAMRSAIESYIQEFLIQSPDRLHVQHSSKKIKSRKGIYMQAKGMTNHELFLGRKLSTSTNSVIHLSTLQLFDLATVMDEYTTDLLALPDIDKKTSLLFSDSFRVAASILLALGLTAYSLQLLNKFYSSQPPSITTTYQKISPQESQEIATTTSPELLAVSEVEPPSPTEAETMLSVESADRETPGTTPSVSSPPSPLPTDPDPGTRQRAIAPPPPPPPPPPQISLRREVIAEPLPTVRKLPQVETSSGANYSSKPPVQSRNTPATDTGFVEEIPQVAEVKAYFQKHWKPPENLDISIEYRLAIARDGTIQLVIPLSKTAENYLDRTKMPLWGEEFVSPIEGELKPTIRVVLNPNGTVQTFLESLVN